MNHFLFIFIGSGLGAVARHALSLALHSPTARMPFGILACNLIGCLAIGIVYGLVKAHHPSWISPLAVTGFLGGFTTFSTFALDFHKLLSQGQIGIAISYILISLLGGLLLCYLGIWAATTYSAS